MYESHPEWKENFMLHFGRALSNIIDILDVILTVNIVLGQEPFNYAADVNSDGIINILDIISLVNIILSPYLSP